MERPLKRARPAATVPATAVRKTAAMATRRPNDRAAQQQSTSSSAIAAANADLSAAIAVFVRCRAVLPTDPSDRSPVVVADSSTRGSSVSVAAANSTKTYSFAGQRVFGTDADQGMLWLDIAKPVIAEAVRGYNCTVFAYGQTSSGKTYTMEGDLQASNGTFSDGAGLIPRILYALFHTLNKQGSDYTISCSYLEIYNDALRDLSLPQNAANPQELRILDEKSGAVQVHGLEEVHISSAEQGVELLRRGSHRRQTAATSCNETSSRSHALFTINIVVQDGGEGGKEDVVRHGKINLVDLAGSENIGRSGVQGSQAREAGQINSSLLALGRVINALADAKTASTHIPYRESKLTRILQDSLGGSAKTFIIATLCPFDAEESLSTLDYASRASTIKNRPEANKRISKAALLANYGAELDRLKREVYAARQKDGVYLPLDDYKAAQAVRDDERAQLKDTLRANEVLESKLSTLEARFEQNAFLLSETVVNLEDTKTSLSTANSNRAILQHDLLETEAERARLQRANEALQTTLAQREAQILALEQDVAALRQFSTTSSDDVLSACQVVQKELQGGLQTLETDMAAALAAGIASLQRVHNSVPLLLDGLQRSEERDPSEQVSMHEVDHRLSEVLDRIAHTRDSIVALVQDCVSQHKAVVQKAAGEVHEAIGEVRVQLEQDQENVRRHLSACRDRLQADERHSAEAAAKFDGLKDAADAAHAAELKRIFDEHNQQAIEREAILLHVITTHLASERSTREQLATRTTATSTRLTGVHRAYLDSHHLQLAERHAESVQEMEAASKSLELLRQRSIQGIDDGLKAVTTRVGATCSTFGNLDHALSQHARTFADNARSDHDELACARRDMIDAVSAKDQAHSAQIDRMVELAKESCEALVAQVNEDQLEVQDRAQLLATSIRQSLVTVERHQCTLLDVAGRDLPPPTEPIVQECAPIAVVPAAVQSSPEVKRRASSQAVSAPRPSKKSKVSNVLRPVDVNRRATNDDAAVGEPAKKRKMSCVDTSSLA